MRCLVVELVNYNWCMGDRSVCLVNGMLKGTSQELEKSYIRLADVPEACTVRPEYVLRRALDRLVGLIRNPGVKYFYSSDQFKVNIAHRTCALGCTALHPLL